MSERHKFYAGKRRRNCSNKLSRYFFGFIFRKKQFSPDLHFVRQIQPFSININFLLILNFNACHSNEVVFYNIMSFELSLIISLEKIYEWFLSTILNLIALEDLLLSDVNNNIIFILPMDCSTMPRISIPAVLSVKWSVKSLLFIPTVISGI